MKYLTVTKARESLLRLVDNLAERTAIMRNGQPVAVLLDFDDYRALCAAQAFARDPERLAKIQAVARRVREGDLSGFQEVPAAPAGQLRRGAGYTAPPAVKATMEEEIAKAQSMLEEVRARIEMGRAEIEALAQRHRAIDHDLQRRETSKKGLWVRDEVESTGLAQDVAGAGMLVGEPLGSRNADALKGQWMRLRGMVRQQWGKLTDDDLDQIQGRSEQLIGKLQERYGFARDEAQRQVDAMTREAPEGDPATKRRDR